MKRGESYRLYPTDAQALRMARSAGCVRAVYNAALEQRGLAWRLCGVSLRSAGQGGRELSELKRAPGLEYLAEVHADAYQQALRDLDQAFANFFAGRAGYPRRRRKGVHDSYRVVQRPSGGRKVIEVRRLNRKWAAVKLPGLGEVRARVGRMPRGQIRSATISRTPLGWQVSLLCEDGRQPVPQRTDGPGVGLDRGVVVSVATSDGEMFSVPQPSPGEQRRRLRLERKLARQRKGSARRERTKRQLARLRAKEARRRKDSLHKLSRDLVDRYSLIAVEDLRTRNMTRSARGTVEQPGARVAQKAGLNRAILAQGWHQLQTFLTYKAEETGATVVLVDPRDTSRRCRACGHTAPENRESQAVFRCVACEHAEHADTHAAKNILADAHEKMIAAGLAVTARGALSTDGSETRTSAPHATGAAPPLAA